MRCESDIHCVSFHVSVELRYIGLVEVRSGALSYGHSYRCFLCLCSKEWCGVVCTSHIDVCCDGRLNFETLHMRAEM